MYDALRLNAARRPRTPAVITPDRVVDHAALADRTTRLSGALEALDPTGTRIGVLVGGMPEHLEVLFATAHLGRCAVPMDPRWSIAEIVAVMRSFGPSLVVVEAELEELLRAACEDARVLPVVVSLGAAYEALLEAAPLTSGQIPLDADYLVAPTGGTTSGLKGALISYGATIMRFLIQATEFGFGSDDVYLAATPLFHGGARSFAMGHLYYGGAVVLPGRLPVDRIPDAVSRYRVTRTFLVPTMLRDLVDLGRPLGDRFRSLIASGSALDNDLRGRLMERVSPHLYNYFASVEAGGIAVSRPTDPVDKSESVGRPVWASELRLLDVSGQPVGLGQVGRVAVRGPATSRGYLNDPESTAQTYIGGAVLTGDLARLDGDGYLWLAGRESDMIISGGINIHPNEVEEVLASHPDVAVAVVLGLPDPRWGEA
ncbi:MAG: AMP-binding protein, partial [Chloroflexi bacterium]|nr:AMP-binding protein [Chloroflexota bacterium]